MVSALLLGLGTQPAGAVSADHGNQVVSDDPANITPHVMDGSVDAITQVGDVIVAAGRFSRVSPATTFADPADDVVRNGIFAFDADTGAIDPGFDPDLGGSARSLDTDGTNIYVGGSFDSVGGRSAIKRVVKLTAGGDVVPGFKAVPNAAVNEVVVRGSRLYIGGVFKSVTSRSVVSARRALAALSTTTGAVVREVNVPFAGVYDPYNRGGGRTGIKRFDVTADGSRLAAIGNFATVGGRRHSQLAVLNTGRSTAAVAPWSTDRFDRARNSCSRVFDSFTRDIDFSPDGSYFVVSTTGAFAGGASSRTMCDSVSRWETASTGNEPTWMDYTGGDTTYGVAVTGGAVYVGGHMRWQNNPFQADQAGPGAVSRQGIAALDPVNGLPLPWNPGRTRGVGAQAVFATDRGLWVGSDTKLLGHERHGRIGFMPLAGGSVRPAFRAATLPNDLFLAQRARGGVLQRRGVDRTGAPLGEPSTANATSVWSSLRGAFLLGDTLYYGRKNGNLYKKTFDAGTGAAGAQQLVDLHDDPDSGARIPFPIAKVSGMFYDAHTHRIYYTLVRDRRLYYRYFTPDSEVVGAQTFQAETNGVGFKSASGMTLASGRILYGSSTNGSLRSVRFSGARVTGRPKVISSDRTWNYRAMVSAGG